jgi:SAM-dependent methyltransferase/uncharacterized protein YbaR (Trm112 family)
VKPELIELLRCPRSGQPLSLDRAVSGPAEDGITHGVLMAEGNSYPIVAGIPLLRPGGADDVVELVHAGRLRDATAAAVVAEMPASRARLLLEEAAQVRGLGRFLGPVERRVSRRTKTMEVRHLFGDPPGDDLVADPLAALFLGGIRPSTEGYNYFRYRFGTPRYLVALALIDALGAPTGPVLDVGCGAGHLTWALTQRTAQPVIGVDPSFVQLLAAKRLAPGAELICGDGRALPLRDAAFDHVLSSDVLPYVHEKPSATREIIRVLAPRGRAVLTALRNARVAHVHGGEPLSPAAWLDLAADLPERRLLGDEEVLDLTLRGLAPGGLGPDGAELSQTVSVVAAHEPLALFEGAWPQAPHSIGPLAVHPLLTRTGATAEGVEYRREFPSEAYHLDNRRLERYLPTRCVIPSAAVDADDRVDAAASDLPPSSLEGLIASVAIMALPPGGEQSPVPGGGGAR